MEKSNVTQIAQSASALGAAILGFGIGAKWGTSVSHLAFIIVLVGGIFHVTGMYITQMKRQTAGLNKFAKALWISAWICLIALIGVIIYLLAV